MKIVNNKNFGSSMVWASPQTKTETIRKQYHHHVTRFSPFLSVLLLCDRREGHPLMQGSPNITTGFTSKYNSKIRGSLTDLELQADLVHETTSGA